ncbi:VCBS repeat-containing protein [Pelagicoccus sp. SDUM812003]|uniref:FG-GAP repeat domain-containing protein n=1 Tax=Pelagicoccus sp. SDUM812003 TaxID=3041267 RepID=UPI00280C6529|nr:VCBS repeat-containing protein [Pelagicoccus sp. SDUM812003]MDQ8205024.1 VCBS repeat-containing protein [Pelagicoccus sp. SDUM812003]
MARSLKSRLLYPVDKTLYRLSAALALSVAAVLLSGCGDAGESSGESERVADSVLGLGYLNWRTIGDPVEGFPWVTDIAIVDLDSDGLVDVVFTEGRLNKVAWIRQVTPGVFAEFVIAEGIAGAAHVEACDLDRDGDLDLLVASMGIVTPNDQKIGSVIVLENDGNQSFSERVLVEGIDRVTDVQAGDLDGDGDLDLSVGAFGYFEGEVFWMENSGNWEFESHNLLSLSGAIHTPVADVDADGDLDIIALVSQDWEEIYLFENRGDGSFQARVLHGSTNKDYGSSGIQLVDMDQDGDVDIAYTNGDGFDYATPGARRWHGVQWLENDGAGDFTFHRIGDLSGAYAPSVTDIDGDGDLDFLATSAFNDWSDSSAVSLACYENLGSGRFEKRILAHAPTHLITLEAGDLDGDGRDELVSGGFYFYPPMEHVSRVSVWDRD